MFQHIDAVLGPRATASLARSALPDAPVLPVPPQRVRFTRRVLGVRLRRDR